MSVSGRLSSQSDLSQPEGCLIKGENPGNTGSAINTVTSRSHDDACLNCRFGFNCQQQACSLLSAVLVTQVSLDRFHWSIALVSAG